MLIFTLAFFLRFPCHLIKLFEVKCSFLDKLYYIKRLENHGFIYAHNAYNAHADSIVVQPQFLYPILLRRHRNLLPAAYTINTPVHMAKI